LSGPEILQIDAADIPAAGGVLENILSNFADTNAGIDLRGLTYVAGASAVVDGSTLELSDGGKTYGFDLDGDATARYAVTSDGHGGVLINPAVTLFAQAAAALAPTAAAKTALASATAPVAQTPFAHAMASAGAGRG
jgi:hypothetical protein